jgi:hypothetical protein
MRRILILSVNIVVTIALTYGLTQYVGMQGFLFAWILNLMLMMCVYHFTESLKSNFSANFYEEKTWEDRGKVYELLGINFFRKLLLWIGWEKLNKKANPIEKNTEALNLLLHRTKQSELGHIIIFIIVMGFTVFVAVKHGIHESLWLLGLNILLNLYPIFLQRFNRPRYVRAILLSNHRKDINQRF